MPADRVPSEYFASDYGAARARFLAAARRAGAQISSHRNPATGPGGEALATDVARLGPPDAERILVTISSTHGAEGFCGSGVQVATLATGFHRELPAGMALLAIHAVNPYGFAWLRRVNEDNVDLNRNYVDHGRSYPANPGYRQLREAICPADWGDAARLRCKAAFDAYAAEHGMMALQSAISSGQYDDPQGVFYGGQAPVWSHRTLTDILRRQCNGARQIGVIDLHTGLGPYGHGEIMNDHDPSEPGYARINAWFGGEATTFDQGTSSSAVTTGSTVTGVTRALPQAQVSEVTLEYGTLPLEEVFDAVRADNWLHVHGDPSSELGKAIKAQMRATFYPDTDDWKRMIWERALDVQRRMAKGLSEA
ncbi:MAG: hypothetical protein BroJett029_29320 [Alphaproteobacteria bacterium]|nr:MAG: hypothetical protein BroJett029_29320 [Alphaproteobacteria bacterium]